MIGKLNEAIEFAVSAHANQVRKGTNIPYITHPIEVMGIIATITDDEEVMMAGVLHDTLEDSSVTEDELKEKFSSKVVELVKAMSENKMREIPSKDSWEIRKQETLKKLSDPACPYEVKVVAIADKLSNVRSIYRDYKVIGDEIFERFNVKEPKKHAWYYEGIADCCEELNGCGAYEEYKEICKKLFEKYLN